MESGGLTKHKEEAKRERLQRIVDSKCVCRWVPGEPLGVYPSGDCPHHGFSREQGKALERAMELGIMKSEGLKSWGAFSHKWELDPHDEER